MLRGLRQRADCHGFSAAQVALQHRSQDGRLPGRIVPRHARGQHTEIHSEGPRGTTLEPTLGRCPCIRWFQPIQDFPNQRLMLGNSSGFLRRSPTGVGLRQDDSQHVAACPGKVFGKALWRSNDHEAGDLLLAQLRRRKTNPHGPLWHWCWLGLGLPPLEVYHPKTRRAISSLHLCSTRFF